VAGEILTILCGTLYRVRGQRTGRFPSGGRYMLPQVTNEVSLDFSMKNELADVAALRDQLMDFCADNGIGEKNANYLALALEEMTANIIWYGYRSGQKNYIDISFTIQDGNYILRIRDDGVPFNPLEQKVSAEGPVVGGIALIRKLMSDFQYTRVLNMNNTVIGLEINDGRQGDLVRRG